MPKSLIDCAKAGYRAMRLYRWQSGAFDDFERIMKGVVERECPVCEYKGRFQPFGHPPRIDAYCPRCKSLERHRLLKLLMDRRDIIPRNGNILHFAPEPVVASFLKTKSPSYISADLAEGRADTVLNIEDIALEADSQDVIVCSHVLEHVDDAKALASMFRVLKPGGRAILMFPIVEGWEETYENPDVRSEEDRELHFGQWDHVRYFGRDVRERIRKAGFDLEEVTAVEPDVLRYGLMRGEKVFVATKPRT